MFCFVYHIDTLTSLHTLTVNHLFPSFEEAQEYLDNAINSTVETLNHPEELSEESYNTCRDSYYILCSSMIAEYNESTPQYLVSQIFHDYKSHNNKNPLYRVWKAMLRRCSSKAQNYRKGHGNDYERYYLSGIRVCREWQSYDNFRSWSLNHGYRPGLQIDRIYNDQSYNSINCRFATPRANSNNRKNTIFVITDENEKIPLSLYCESHNIPYKRAHDRIRRGYTIREAVGIDKEWNNNEK